MLSQFICKEIWYDHAFWIKPLSLFKKFTSSHSVGKMVKFDLMHCFQKIREPRLAADKAVLVRAEVVERQHNLRLRRLSTPPPPSPLPHNEKRNKTEKVKQRPKKLGTFVLLLCLFRGGGVLPYITYTGMCRPTGSWFWSSWFRTGYPFQRLLLERGIKNCGSRLYLLLKIVADYEEAFIWCISGTNKEISF